MELLHVPACWRATAPPGQSGADIADSPGGSHNRERTENGRSPTGQHILAINSDQAVLGLVRDLLEDEGFRVSTQAYVDKDMAEIERLVPDLIILDYMWAADDGGWSLLQMLRMNPKTAAIPIILCTGAVHKLEALSAHLLDMGVRVVHKPFSIYHLLKVIAEALEITPSDVKPVQLTD